MIEGRDLLRDLDPKRLNLWQSLETSSRAFHFGSQAAEFTAANVSECIFAAAR